MRKKKNTYNFLPSVILVLCLLAISCKKDNVNPDATIQLQVLARLPAVLSESSGLYVETSDRIWSHNDKGGKAELYAINKSGTLLKTLAISNASNKDWEDIAQDSQGNVYISDSGNNDNNRQNLRIYKITESDLDNNSATAEIIHFELSDQTAFPPSNNNMKYDIESLIAMGDSLYLFTRDRTKPFRGETRLYILPQTPGTHVAQYKSSFTTHPDKDTGGIRAAAISPSGDKLLLLSKTNIWQFSNFVNGDFFAGEVKGFSLSTNTQKEGIDFIDDCTIYISDEDGDGGGNLYRVNICL